MFTKLKKFLIATGVALSAATFLNVASNVSFATNSTAEHFYNKQHNAGLFLIKEVNSGNRFISRKDGASGFIEDYVPPENGHYTIGFLEEDFPSEEYPNGVLLHKDTYEFSINVCGLPLEEWPADTLFTVGIFKKDNVGGIADENYINNVQFADNFKLIVKFNVNRDFMTDGNYDIIIRADKPDGSYIAYTLNNIEISYDEVEQYLKI